MLKSLSVFVLAITAFSTFAGETPSCTSWQKQQNLSCVFAGQFADVYERQCASHYGKERLCHFNDPATFNGVCSEWTAESGISCYNPNTQSWDQKWVRSCTVYAKESACSAVAPQ